MKLSVNHTHYDLIAVREAKYTANVGRKLQPSATDQSCTLSVHR